MSWWVQLDVELWFPWRGGGDGPARDQRVLQMAHECFGVLPMGSEGPPTVSAFMASRQGEPWAVVTAHGSLRDVVIPGNPLSITDTHGPAGEPFVRWFHESVERFRVRRCVPRGYMLIYADAQGVVLVGANKGGSFEGLGVAGRRAYGVL